MMLRGVGALHTVITIVAFGVASGCDGERNSAPERLLYTRLAFAEQIRVGSPVKLSGIDVGKVVAIQPAACDSVILELAVSRGDAPLFRGTVAQVRPSGLLGGEFIALLPPDTAAVPLPTGAWVPGLSRAATAAQRRAAMRLILPAIGLPSMAALVPPDSTQPDSASRAASRVGSARSPGSDGCARDT